MRNDSWCVVLNLSMFVESGGSKSVLFLSRFVADDVNIFAAVTCA
jgi:hypothetical protein